MAAQAWTVRMHTAVGVMERIRNGRLAFMVRHGVAPVVVLLGPDEYEALRHCLPMPGSVEMYGVRIERMAEPGIRFFEHQEDAVRGPAAQDVAPARRALRLVGEIPT